MIRRWDQRAREGTLNFAQALGLADSLASLLDEPNARAPISPG